MAHWSYNEFLAFVLVYAANSDQQVVSKELDFLYNRFDVDLVNRMQKEFNDLSDSQCVDRLLMYKESYVSDKVALDKLLEDVSAVYLADGKMVSEEKMALMMLRRILA
ncbi:MAG: hypothetical protein GC178_08740 [Flavobacteriales bacterium]|nr:hypothetical protein [Flavobacteriales bacterium]